MSWSVRVAGVQYESWTSLKFSRSIKDNTGRFSFETTDKSPGLQPIRANEVVTIFYKSTLVFTGYLDVLNFKGSRSGSTIGYSGRGIMSDLADSSLPDSSKAIKGSSLTIKSTASLILSALGITGYQVIDKTKESVGEKKVKLQKVGASGASAMQFLAKLAAANQVWLVENESGNLEIIRAGEVVSDFKFYYLIKGDGLNNILDADLKIDLSNSFYKIKVRGKGSVAYNVSSQSDGDIVDIFGENLDDWSRKTRYLEIKNTDIKSSNAAKSRALDEVNLRRAKALEYRILTNSFVDKSGKILRIGDLVFVEDEQRSMFGKFVVASFDVSFDRAAGTQVNILLAPAEAYQIVEIDDRESKVKKTSSLIKKG